MPEVSLREAPELRFFALGCGFATARGFGQRCRGRVRDGRRIEHRGPVAVLTLRRACDPGGAGGLRLCGALVLLLLDDLGRVDAVQHFRRAVLPWRHGAEDGGVLLREDRSRMRVIRVCQHPRGRRQTGGRHAHRPLRPVPVIDGLVVKALVVLVGPGPLAQVAWNRPGLADPAEHAGQGIAWRVFVVGGEHPGLIGTDAYRGPAPALLLADELSRALGVIPCFEGGGREHVAVVVESHRLVLKVEVVKRATGSSRQVAQVRGLVSVAGVLDEAGDGEACHDKAGDDHPCQDDGSDHLPHQGYEHPGDARAEVAAAAHQGALPEEHHGGRELGIGGVERNQGDDRHHDEQQADAGPPDAHRVHVYEEAHRPGQQEERDQVGAETQGEQEPVAHGIAEHGLARRHHGDEQRDGHHRNGHGGDVVAGIRGEKRGPGLFPDLLLLGGARGPRAGAGLPGVGLAGRPALLRRAVAGARVRAAACPCCVPRAHVLPFLS